MFYSEVCSLEGKLVLEALVVLRRSGKGCCYQAPDCFPRTWNR